MFILSYIKKINEIGDSLDQATDKYKVMLDISDFKDQTVKKVIDLLTGPDHALVAFNLMSPPPEPVNLKQPEKESQPHIQGEDSSSRTDL